MKKIKAFFDNGRSKREEERAESSDYAAAIAKLPKLETLAVNLNIIDSLPLTGSKVGPSAALLFYEGLSLLFLTVCGGPRSLFRIFFILSWLPYLKGWVKFCKLQCSVLFTSWGSYIP
jgi:hypothetical protein